MSYHYKNRVTHYRDNENACPHNCGCNYYGAPRSSREEDIVVQEVDYHSEDSYDRRYLHEHVVKYAAPNPIKNKCNVARDCKCNDDGCYSSKKRSRHQEVLVNENVYLPAPRPAPYRKECFKDSCKCNAAPKKRCGCGC